MRKRKDLFHILLATTIVVGMTIGTGIFFQNRNIISWSQGNAIIVIVSWMIGAIIAMTTTLSYVEIVRFSKRSNTGVGQFAESVINKKVGWHTKMNWANYYYSFFTFAGSCFVAKFITNLFVNAGALSAKSDYTWLIILIGISIFLIFTSINVFLPKIGELLQINLTILKAIPLIIISIGGLITLFFLNKYGNWWSNSSIVPLPTTSTSTKHFSAIAIILFILPAILFSFDGSIGVANLTEDIRNRKHITFALIVGMSIVTIIYLLVTVAILNTGTLNAENAIIKMFGGDINKLTPTYKILSSFMQIFITIAGLGVVNVLSLTWSRSMKAIIKKPTPVRIFLNCIFTSLFSFIIPLSIITFVINYTNLSKSTHLNVDIINSIAMNTTIITYTIYSTIIAFGLYRHIKDKKANTINSKYDYKKWFPYVSIISIIGVLTVVLYQFIYIFFFNTISNPSSIINGMRGWVYMILCIIYILWYLLLPMILKKVFKNNYKNNF